MTNRASSVDRLPEEIRRKITELRDKGFTIDKILEVLNTLTDEPPSRSALGRHLKKQSQVVESIRRSRAIAEGIGRTFGDKEASNVARTNIELLHSMIMRLMSGGDDTDADTIEIDAKEAMFLATALEKATKAQKADFETQLKAALEQERRQTAQKAAEVAVDTAKKQGLSKETVEAIKKSILGIE